MPRRMPSGVREGTARRQRHHLHANGSGRPGDRDDRPGAADRRAGGERRPERRRPQPAGWAVGVTCGAITNAGLARGLSHYRSDRLGPANWVTLARATLAVGIAALVADSFAHAVPVTMLTSLAAGALALDAVDGWVARRTRTAATLGAHFDAEVDAFLILVLSVYVARSAGAWVLAIGAARYVVPRRGLAAGMDARAAAAALLAQGRRRDAGDRPDHRDRRRPVAGADPGRPRRRARPACRVLRPRRVVAATAPAGRRSTPSARPLRTGFAVALTTVALLLVWAALVAPDQPSRLTLGAFARLPLELARPRRAGRAPARLARAARSSRWRERCWACSCS